MSSNLENSIATTPTTPTLSSSSLSSSSSMMGDIFTKKNFKNLFNINDAETCFYDEEQAVVERKNLINIMKLVIKELIECGVNHERNLNSNHPTLKQFFIILEHCVTHGFKQNIQQKLPQLFPQQQQNNNNNIWNLLELLSENIELIMLLRDLPTVKSNLGRFRSFIRIALMQKKLGDYFKILIEKNNEEKDFYEDFAFMKNEEGNILAGILLSINFIDFSFCLKEENLDNQILEPINFSIYLKAVTNNCDSNQDDNNPELNDLLDQKNYIEELNKHLNSTLLTVQVKSDAMATSNKLQSDELLTSKNLISQLQEENSKLIKKISEQNSNQEFSDAEAEQNYEQQQQQDDNNKIDWQKNESSEAMRLMEKDVQEKQDTIISLRKQLEDIKNINLEMYRKLQECEQTINYKTELNSKLELKVAMVDETIKKLEDKLSGVGVENRASQKEMRILGQKIAEKELKISTLESDLRIEREWRQNLQEKSIKDKEKISELSMEISKINNNKITLETLVTEQQSQLEKLLSQINVQEKTLYEMGLKVAESKLLADDLRENSSSSKWKNDKDFKNCNFCEKEFNLTRRRHHCRSCGNIFCNNCSDNSMELPSSSKPVRVCDKCYTFYLTRFNQ